MTYTILPASPPPPVRRRPPLAPIAAVLAVIVAAVGAFLYVKPFAKDEAPAAAAKPAASKKTTRMPTDAQLLAHARKVLLRPTDLPRGWQADGSTHVDTEDNPSDAAFYGCLGLTQVTHTSITSAEFGAASDSGMVQVSSAIDYYGNSRSAAASYSRAVLARLPACVEALVPGLLTEQGPGMQVIGAAARVVKVPRLGDHAAGVRMTARLQGPSGQQLPFTLEIYGSARGSTDVTVVLIGVGDTPPAGLGVRLLSGVAGRVRAHPAP